MNEPILNPADCELLWSKLMPKEEWELHRRVLAEVRARNVDFALGGGLTYSTYTRRLRNTKDLDLFFLPANKDAMIDAVKAAGFEDHYPQKEYDRSWIYRSCRGEVIVDLIWTMPNHRLEVDEQWLTRGPEIDVCGEHLRLLPIEELLCSKLYVVQRDRTDWPDMLNVMAEQWRAINWEHLFWRLGQDIPLFASFMTLYRWLCPSRALELPSFVWERLGLPIVTPSAPGQVSAEDEWERAKLLDTRDWFGRHDQSPVEI